MPEFGGPFAAPFLAVERRHEERCGAQESGVEQGDDQIGWLFHTVVGLLGRDEAFEQRIALAGSLERRFAGGGDLVVLARGALFGVGDGLAFPLGADEFVAFETAHGGVDGSAGEARHLHDAESVDVAGGDRLQDHRGGMREFCLGGHAQHSTYVAIYLTMDFI